MFVILSDAEDLCTGLQRRNAGLFRFAQDDKQGRE